MEMYRLRSDVAQNITDDYALECAKDYIDCHGNNDFVEWLARQAPIDALLKVGREWHAAKSEAVAAHIRKTHPTYTVIVEL